jgi:hypothetical protein
MTFQEAFVDRFVSDKFGESTTHWRKLEDRVRRGVGNPCPLLLIGLPDSIVTFHEGDQALQEVLAEEEEKEETEDRQSPPSVVTASGKPDRNNFYVYPDDRETIV